MGNAAPRFPAGSGEFRRPESDPPERGVMIDLLLPGPADPGTH
jgi:hypothetical protein